MNPFEVVRVAHVKASDNTTPWLVTGLWGEQSVGFIGGTPKSCKTWLSLELAVAVASGRPCLGRFPVHRPGPVVVYAAEDAAMAVRTRVEGIARARGVNLNRLAVGLINESSVRLDNAEHRERLDATVAKVRPRLLILDPLVRLHAGDENSAADVSRMLGFLRDLQRRHRVAIALVHHVRKSGAAQPGQALRGSGDLHAWSDSSLFLIKRKGQLELHAEHRAHRPPEPFVVELRQDPLHLAVVGGSEAASPPDALSDQIVAVLSQEPMTRTALRDRLRIRNERLSWALVALGDRVRRVDGRLTVPCSDP